MPFLRVQDQDLFYSWHAAGDGPVLLFIHGLGSSNSFYAPIIPSLVQQGYSCLAFDTPGEPPLTYRCHGTRSSGLQGRESLIDHAPPQAAPCPRFAARTATRGSFAGQPAPS